MIVECRTEEGGRDYQQDAFGWTRLAGPGGGERACCVVADGMGGVKGGGVASRLAVSTILRCLYPPLLLERDGKWKDRGYCDAAVRSAFSDASAIFGLAADGCPKLEQMGTTIALVIEAGSTVLVAHSGDSRVYALSDSLELITADHSVAWELVESEVVDASEVRNVGTRSVLTHSLTADGAEFDTALLDAGEAVAYLLATDGLWELFDTSELEDILLPVKDGGDAARVADELMDDALARGPDDNLTFLLFVPERGGRPQTGRYPCPSRMPFFTPVDTGEETHGA